MIPTRTLGSDIQDEGGKISSILEKFSSSLKHIQVVEKVVGEVSKELPLIGSGVKLLLEARKAHQDYKFNQQAFETLQDRFDLAGEVYCKASALILGRSFLDCSDDSALNKLGSALKAVEDILPGLSHLKQNNTTIDSLHGMSEVPFDEKLIHQVSARIEVAVQGVKDNYGSDLFENHQRKLKSLLNELEDMDFRSLSRYPSLNEQKVWLSKQVKLWVEAPFSASEPSAKSVLWLQSKGGMGKSHFCSSLAKDLYKEGQLVSCLGFRFNNSSRNHPMALIKSLVYYQFRTALMDDPDGSIAYFFECLIDQHDLSTVLNKQTYNEEDLRKALVLIQYGLKVLYQNNLGERAEVKSTANACLEERKPLLLIIDAVNEVDPKYKHLLGCFLSVISEYLKDMPNIKMLVTSTDHAQDFGLSDLCECVSFNDATSVEGNRRDVELYLRDCWTGRDVPTISKEDEIALLKYIYESSGGKFIVLKLMESRLKELPRQWQNVSKMGLGKELNSWLLENLDFSGEKPYEHYIAQIPEKHYPVIAVMVAMRVPLSLAEVAALAEKKFARLIQSEKHEFNRLFILNEEDSTDMVESKFQVYHESVFVSLDKLRGLGRAVVYTLQSTQILIREIIKAEERISTEFDKLYQCFVVEDNHSANHSSIVLKTLFSSEYINFFLKQGSRYNGRSEMKEVVNKLSRCVTLKWIKWRLSNQRLRSSDSFSTLFDDYNRVAVFDTMEDQSLKVACKVMFQLLKPSIIDIKTFDETRFQLVCTQICSRLVSIDVKVSDNIYITKLKTEAEEYLRDLGGWILTNPILPQVKLDSVDEKIIFIQNGDLSTRLYEFGPVTNRCLVSFTSLPSNILLVEVFELNSLSKLLEKRIQIYLNLNLITQLDENIFIFLNEEMMIQRLEIDTIAREVRFSDSHGVPKDFNPNYRGFIATKGKEDGEVRFVWSEKGKIWVCREEFPGNAVDLPSPFIFDLDINMNVLINDRIFITINFRELYEFVNFNSLQRMFTCEFECYRTVVLSDGLFLYGNKRSHLLKFNSNGIISSIHTHDTIHNDLKGWNKIFTGASHVYVSTPNGSLILPNTVVAMQQRFCYEHVPLTLRESSTGGYCFDNGSEKYCFSLSRWNRADLYIKSAKLIKSFQMSRSYYQTKPQSLGKDFLVLKDNENKDLLLFLINYVDIDESIFIRLSGDIRDYFLLKVWRREDNNIHCLGFKDSNFFHIILQESERGYNHSASELPYNKTSDCLVSNKLKEVYQAKGASENCNNYYEGIDEDGRSHLLEYIVKDANGESRIEYKMRCCYCHDKMGERILGMMVDKKKLELLYSPYECEYTSTVYQMKLERVSDYSRYRVRERRRLISSQSAAWKEGLSCVIPVLDREYTTDNLILQFDGLDFKDCLNGQTIKEIYYVASDERSKYYEGIDGEGRSHLISTENDVNEVSTMRCVYSCETRGERILHGHCRLKVTSVFRANARYYKEFRLKENDSSDWDESYFLISHRSNCREENKTILFLYNDLANKRSFVFNSIDQMFLAESLIGCTCNFHFPINILNNRIRMKHFTVLSHKRYDRKDRGVGGGVEVEVMIHSLICVKIFYPDEMMKNIGRPKEEEIREEEEEVIETIEEETKISVDDKDTKEASTQTEIEGEDEVKSDHHRKEDNKEAREKGRREEKVFEGLVRVWLKWVMKCFFAVISMLRRSPMIIVAIVIILIAIFMSWKRK